MKNKEIKELIAFLEVSKESSYTIAKDKLLLLLKDALYADKASYILESMPVDLDDMLEGYDDDEENDIT